MPRNDLEIRWQENVLAHQIYLCLEIGETRFLNCPDCEQRKQDFARNLFHYIAYNPPYPDDKKLGWGDWSDEYRTIYPDGVAVRKIIMWSSNLDRRHEWCQSLPIFQPGQKPEDVLDEKNFLSLANLAGQSHTYSWPPPSGDYSKWSFKNPEVPNQNIQIVNYKSKLKPFLILTDNNPRIKFAPFVNRKRPLDKKIVRMSMPLNSKFFCWNHWPVAQLPNDGRIAEYPDRPAHSFTSTQDCDPYETTKNSITKIMLCGLTDKKIEELIPLGRSWCKPPELKILAGKFVYNGFDQTQKAYLVNCVSSSTLKLTLSSNELSPIVNPCFVISNWGQQDAAVTVNGMKPKAEDVKVGHPTTVVDKDLIVWLRMESDDKATFVIESAE